MVEIGVKALLGSDPQFNLLEVCKTQAALLKSTRQHQPDVVVCGLSRESELGGIQELQAAAPGRGREGPPVRYAVRGFLGHHPRRRLSRTPSADQC